MAVQCVSVLVSQPVVISHIWNGVRWVFFKAIITGTHPNTEGQCRKNNHENNKKYLSKTIENIFTL